MRVKADTSQTCPEPVPQPDRQYRPCEPGSRVVSTSSPARLGLPW